VPPCIDRGHRHFEIRSEIFDSEQLAELFHVGNRESRGLQMDDRSLSTGPRSVLLSICNPFVTLRAIIGRRNRCARCGRVGREDVEDDAEPACIRAR
jgi:hypothetical protein